MNLKLNKIEQINLFCKKEKKLLILPVFIKINMLNKMKSNQYENFIDIRQKIDKVKQQSMLINCKNNDLYTKYIFLEEIYI